MADASPFDRFLLLAKRELAAEDVRLFGPGEAPPEAPNVVVVRLSDGRHVAASFADAPANTEAVARRLSMLATTFADAVGSPPSERQRTRPPVVSSLHEELKALAQRAGAADAVVIDVSSPVVWGSASVRARPRPGTRRSNEVVLREVKPPAPSPPSDAIPADSTGASSPDVADVRPSGTDVSRIAPEESAYRLLDDEDSDAPATNEADGDGEEPLLTRRTIDALRRLPELDEVLKGRHLRHVVRDDAFYLVLSFSGIYLLCLVFAEAFDELRAERAAQDALGRVERLVLALPPLDPEPPMGGVVALRSRKR